MREELALYYSSVRRADDCVGEILAALKASGEEKNTVVFFMSDHGMPLPFAKTQLYHHSTHTPWMVRWSGVTKAGAVDTRHMISAVDFLPTVLDVVGAKHPERLDGRSYLALLKDHPGLSIVHCNLGDLFVLEGEMEKALIELNLCLEADKEDTGALLQRARLFIQQGNDESARTDLKELKRLLPHDSGVLELERQVTR